MSFLVHEGFVGHSAVGLVHNCLHLHSFGQLHFRFRRIYIVLLRIIMLYYDSYGRDLLKVPRLHQHFQTPTCFFPFLLGSPQSRLHTLFQAVVCNSSLSCCLYSIHEWLGSWYANCYLTELTIMVCVFLFLQPFLYIHVFSLTIHFIYCCFRVDFVAFKLCSVCVQHLALWDLIPSWGLSLTAQYKYKLYFNIFGFILASFKRGFVAISQFLFDILVLQWFSGHFKQFIWGKHNLMFYK